MRRLAGIAGAAAALLGLLAGPTGAVAQVSRGPIERVEAPRVPGLSVPASGLDALSGPWDPLGLLGSPSVAGPGPFAAARAAEAASQHASDVIVIPALFSDSDEPFVPATEIQRILFDGPREGGTFVEFYEEVSRGAVSPSGTVAGWVRTGVTMYGAAGYDEDDGHGWIGDSVQVYVKEAVALADPEIDFRLYDNDGPDGVPDSGDDNGFVDVLVIEFLEVPGSCGGPSIWPHFSAVFEGSGEGRVDGVPTDDIGHDGTPIRAYTYLTQGVTDCTGQAPQGPNVIAHEYGHRLGLPDWYQAVNGIEPWNRHWNVGCFGLMGAGSWGCGDGAKLDDFGPVHMMGYSKYVLGWIERETVREAYEQEYVLEPAQTTGRTLHFPLDPANVEAMYVEYRPQVGFDEWLPAGGVVISHRDGQWSERNVPSGLPPAKPLHVVEADGDHALRKVEALGGNRGVAGDVFGIEGRTGPYSSAEGPVRLLRSDGTPVPLTIHSVVADGDEARLVLSFAASPRVMASEAGDGLRVLDEGTLATLRIAGGALPYTVQDVDLRADFTATVVGRDVVLEGTPLVAGTVDLAFEVHDALGTRAGGVVTVAVEDAPVSLDRLVDAAAGVPDSGDHGGYLDAQGNRNGRPDVGDLRAYLRRAGGGS